MTICTRTPVSGEEERILLAFGQYLSVRMAPTSVAAYQSDIRLFAEETPEANLLRITGGQEDEYIDALYRMRRKERTIQRKSTAFRYFREFVEENGLRGIELSQRHSSFASDGAKASAHTLDSLKARSAIDRTIKAFLNNVAENRSHSTVRAYTADLLKFRQALQKTKRWECVSQQSISQFINQQIAAGLSPNSRARLFSTIRSLFRWLKQNGKVIGNPTLGLHVPRAKKRFLVPSVRELEGVASARPPSLFSAIRSALILELLYICGLAPSELLSLDIDAIDTKQQKLKVRGRRDRERYLDLPESTARLLAKYLPARDEIACATSALVINLRGGRLTLRSIDRIIAQLSAAGRLPKGTRPHSLRKAHAVYSLGGGKDMQKVRHDLGISGVSATLEIGAPHAAGNKS